MWWLARDVPIDGNKISKGSQVLNIYQVDEDVFRVSIRDGKRLLKLRVRAADLTTIQPS